MVYPSSKNILGFIIWVALLFSCNSSSEKKITQQLNTLLGLHYKSENFDKQTHRSDSKYTFSRVDLNQDGKKDFIILLSSKYFCGTGGCNALIVDGVGGAIVAELNLVSEPIFI